MGLFIYVDCFVYSLVCVVAIDLVVCYDLLFCSVLGCDFGICGLDRLLGG